jgi:hypothetical protein
MTKEDRNELILRIILIFRDLPNKTLELKDHPLFESICYGVWGDRGPYVAPFVAGSTVSSALYLDKMEDKDLADLWQLLLEQTNH